MLEIETFLKLQHLLYIRKATFVNAGTKKIYIETGKGKECMWQKGIVAVRFPEMIFTLAKQQRGINKNNVTELLYISKTEAYKLL